MRKFYFIIVACLLCYFSSETYARQYNIDYLMQLIEDENTEAVYGFFERPNYVSKVKHIIEFGELFRVKLEEHFVRD